MSKRLNIMLYSASTGDQIILPVNPENISIKREKEVKTYDILGFGQVNISSNRLPVKITLFHFLPENNSIFARDANATYYTESGIIEYKYSISKVVEILRKWAINKNKIRLVIDDELNIEGVVTSFTENLRESVKSKHCELEFLEYRNPNTKTLGLFGLLKRVKSLNVPDSIVMKNKDTVYSIANKYGLNFKTLAKINNIKNVNEPMPGTRLNISGANV